MNSMPKKKPEHKKVHVEKLAKAKEILSRMNVIDFPVPQVTKGMSEEDHRDAVETIVWAILIEGSQQQVDGEKQAQALYDLYYDVTGEEFSGIVSDEEVEKLVDFFMSIPNRGFMFLISSLQEKSLLYMNSMTQNMNSLIASLPQILQNATTTGVSIQTSENEE